MTTAQEAIQAGLDRVASSTCSSCGFFDPEAIDDDPDLVEKIFVALTGGPRFVCHESMPQNILGQYVPSKAQCDAATLCAGFAAVKAELSKRGLLEKPPRNLVVALCREIVARGRTFPCIPSKVRP